MNNVLLTTAPDSSAAPKVKSSRQAFDSKPPADDASGFAGVLANQAAPQSQNSSTATSESSTGPRTPESGTPAPTHTNTESQQPKHAQHSGHTDGSTAARHARQTDNGLAHSTQIQAFGQPAQGTTTGNTSPATTDSTDATLPQRFAQIIAALEQSGGRRPGLVPEGSNAPARTSASATDATGLAPANARGRLPGNIDRPAAADGSKLPDNRNTTFAEINGQKRSTLTDGRQTVAERAVDNDAALFSMKETHRASAESRSGTALHSAIATPDALLNPVTAGSGFSLIPGSLLGNDIMTTSAAVNQPLFSRQWGPELGRQFVSLIRPGENGSHIAELRLDPPELGPLRITININDSVVQAMFTSAHANVRNAVEQAMPQLQQQLQQEGLSLGQTSVGHDDGASQTQPDLAKASIPAGQNEAEVSTTPAPSHPRVSDALVDTFA